MRVVLLDDIANLGEAGAIVEVKNGYARNFLLPRRLAERATADAVNRVGLIQRAAEVKRARRKSESAEKFTRLAGQQITLTVKAGTQGRIFGSITSSAIVDEVRKQLGVELDRRHVMLEEPIKHLGEFTVPLRAAADVTGELKVVVDAEGPRGQRGRGRGSAGGRETAAPEPAAPEGTETADGGAEGTEASATTEPTDSADSGDVPEHYEELETEAQG